MRRAPKFTSMVTAAAALLLALGAPQLGAVQGVSAPSTDDFPSLDSGIWNLQRRGLALRATERGLAETPLDPATLDLAFQTIGWYFAYQNNDAVLDSLRRLAAGDPDDVELAATYLATKASDIQRDESRDYRPDIEALVAAVRARIPELEREQAARVVSSLLPLENPLARNRRTEWQQLLRQFVEDYDGTEAAMLAQIQLIADPRDPQAEIELLDAFIREHPGTCAGAAALYSKGNVVAREPRRRRGEPREDDPTGRFMGVLAIVEELESGVWPDCPVVDNAWLLIADFYALGNATFAPGNLERVLDALRRFAIAHANLLGRTQANGRSFDPVVTYHLANLFERQDNRVGGIEQTFDALEAVVDDVDVLRLMRAEFYISEARDSSSSRSENGDAPDDRAALIGRAIRTLGELAESDDERTARKGLATLAALYFYERRFEPAVAAYERYLSRWPESDWAWVARMRIGQVHEETGDWEAAFSSYRRAASDYAELPPAVVLANVFAARAGESLGRFDAALAHYRTAAAGWDADFGTLYGLETRHAPLDGGGDEVFVTNNIARADFTERIAQLASSSRFPEGALLESGRRLLAQERWDDARIQLEPLAYGNPSPLRTEALYLAHRARLERALEAADIESPNADPDAAYDELVALAQEAWDPAVGAAKLARAAIMAKAGLDADARTLTHDALQEWLARQPRHFEAMRHEAGGTEAGNAAIHDDVAAIRDVVFRPLGADFYDNPRGRWNAFDWPEQLPPFLIMSPDLTVRLAHRSEIRIRVLDPLPDLDNVLFLSNEHVRFLTSILRRLGGTATRPPRAIMETPNQPIGPSVEILALWKELFPGRPGHWGGWDLRSYPVISSIEFRNEERTEAAAAVTIGYSGCSVVLEKRDGAWEVVRLSNFWIT